MFYKCVIVIFGCLFTHCLSPTVAKSTINTICENVTKSLDAASMHGQCTLVNGSTLHCIGGIENIDFTQPAQMDITELILFCWPVSHFDAPLVLNHFPNIRTLRIEQSDNLTHIEKDFPALHNLETINVSWTRMKYTRPTLFTKLPVLKFVDLRWNHLDHMEGPLLLNDGFQSLYLAGNFWNCTFNMKWMLNHTKNERVIDREDLKCSDSKYFNRPLMTVMQYKLNLREACTHNPELKNCTCNLSYIGLSNDGSTLLPRYTVNCSGLQFFRLPKELPENTTTLYANDNQISSVDPLRTDPYKFVEDIFLEHNLIHSIDTLENEYWLNHFRVFSLKGNKLTKIPVYLLHNALDRNSNAVKLFLSVNPWTCDCIFTLRFQELLQRFHLVIKDAANITCKYIEGDENFGAKVLELRRGDLCKLTKEYKIQPLDLLNGVLGSLIILVLGKLAFDYYHYRKSGRLPWIVSKLP